MSAPQQWKCERCERAYPGSCHSERDHGCGGRLVPVVDIHSDEHEFTPEQTAAAQADWDQWLAERAAKNAALAQLERQRDIAVAALREVAGIPHPAIIATGFTTEWIQAAVSYQNDAKQLAADALAQIKGVK